MEAPRRYALIPGMNEPGIDRLLSGLDGPAAAAVLLQRLGFRRPRAFTPAGLPDSVRRLRRSDRGTLTGYLVELRGELAPGQVQQCARFLRSLDAVRHHLLLLVDGCWRRVVLACDAPAAGVRSVAFDRTQVRPADIEVLRDLEPQPGEGDSAAALRLLRALDRGRVGSRFFRDVVAVRDRMARCWEGVPLRAGAERDGLALLVLSRLTFLYFLQRRGLLAGDHAFLPRLLREWLHERRVRRSTFYRARLRVLFFGVLNRRPERRTAVARSFGALPYLNGGLFEVHRLERNRPQLDLPDEAVTSAFTDLLEKYRFTTNTEAAAGELDAGGVDPEMLGRIFEGLMPGERRDRTGTFYTPAPMVDRVVTDTLALHLSAACDAQAADIRSMLARARDPLVPRASLEAGTAAALETTLGSIRILDPACGSGAFLLGALEQVAALRLGIADARASSGTTPVERGSVLTALRRETIARSLHGVDLLEDAALICSLRLWLTLVPHADSPADVPPLPNLDRRVRQGDALVDPLDIGASIAGRPLDTTAPPELRALTALLERLSQEYLVAEPDARPALRTQLAAVERRVARAWLGAHERRIDWEARELHARAGDMDLFGQPATHAHAATRRLDALERRRAELAAFSDEACGRRRLPFFSFRVHFAEAHDGFDIIVSNPPWVRAHRWPPATRRLLRDRYQVCSAAGWPAAARLVGAPGAGAQVDLSLLFLERSVHLLRRGGTLGMLLPAKLLRSLYAGGARELLARSMHIAALEDHSLDHRTIFDADAFTCVLLARRPTDDLQPAPPVRVTLRRRGREPLSFRVTPDELPLVAGDARSPWLLAPPGCRDALRRMQQSGAPLGESLEIRRGVITGANEVMVVRDVEPKLGDIAHVRTEGYHRALSPQTRKAYAGWVEASAIRPALRGTDVAPWRTLVRRHLLWSPCNDDARLTPPARLGRFLRRHRGRLRQRDHELGTLQRLSRLTLGHKVVWSDLASDLRAAAVPPHVRCVTGATTPVVPLNSVYFIATPSHRESLLLAAYLNSLPIRTFARAIAERAKDAHFRFFAWTIALLPLPPDWRCNPAAEPLLALSTRAHRRGAISAHEQEELDRIVASTYGIDAEGRRSLAAFDAWLRTPVREEDVDDRAAG